MMLGMIAREYFTELRRKQASAREMAVLLIWIIYCLFALPALLGYFDSVRDAAIYMAAAIPFGWAAIDSYLWQIRLPKLMFLCPMDKKARRSYVRGACRFRVIFHTALGALGAALSLLWGNDWPGAAGMAANMFLFSILCIGVDTSGEVEDADTDEQYMSRMGRLAVRIIGTALAIILQIIYADAARSGGLMCQAGWEQIVIGCMSALLLLFVVRYGTYWRAMQEDAIHYEQAERRSRRVEPRREEG